jgi:hypothetical protein
MQKRVSLNKTGSISISINMIVVVVLAFVMLGLLLGLGRQIIGQSQDTAISVIGQTKQDIQNELIRNDEPLYFSQREYDVGFGKQATFNFGIKNVDPIDANLKVEIVYIDPVTGAAVPLDSSKTADSSKGGAFFWAKIAQKYGAGEDNVFDVQYRAPRAKDTYLFKFKLIDEANPDVSVAEQVIFINVI